jgi:pilus assembly protein CpaE
LKSSFGQKTLLIDFHPDQGDAALFLSLEKYQYNFYDLAENTHRLDSELLQGFVVRHNSGLEILPAPDGFSGVHRQIPSENIEVTLDFLRTRYDFIILDCPPGLNEYNVAAIRRSDLLYVVTTPELPAVRNVARYLDHLNRYSFPQDHVYVVVNRHSKRDTVPVDQIEKAVRKKIFWKIPNQYAEVVKMINLGAAGSRGGGSEFMRSMNGWAETLTGRSAEGTKKKGILGLWG